MENNIFEVNAEYLKKFFESEDFSEALKTCLDITYNKGHESSLSFNKYFSNSKWYLESIIEGGCDKIGDGEKIYDCLSDGTTYASSILESYPFIDAHFHPCKEFTICPSTGDLISSLIGNSDDLYEQKYETRCLKGIAQVDDKKDVKMLLIQPLADYSESFQEVLEELDYKFSFLAETKNKENLVIRHLEESLLFKSGMIYFKKSNGKYIPKTTNILEKFGFTPRKIK